MKRHIWHKLQEWQIQKRRKPLILNGVRQCGKTHALQHLARTCFAASHYFNFEKDKKLQAIFKPDLLPSRILDELGYYQDKPIDIEHDLVIFDEIQSCPEALTSLKYFHEEMPKLALCCAGSLLGVSLNTGSFPVGMVNLIDMFPLSFSEFLLAIDEKSLYELFIHCNSQTTIPTMAHQRFWERMKWYWITGGLPEVVQTFCENKDNLFHAFNAVRNKQKELIKTYYADIAKHAGKVNAMHIDRVWNAVPIQLSQSHDASAKRFKFKDIIPGYSRYDRLASAIDWLLAAKHIIKINIINTAELPLFAYTQENNFKLALFDVGILGALSDLSFQTLLNYDFGTYKGYYAENFVAQELLAAGHEKLYCWEQNRSEVEFILNIDTHALPLEVKSGWITRAKSLQKFYDKYHPPYMTILSAHNLKIDQRNAIHHYPLYLASRFPLG